MKDGFAFDTFVDLYGDIFAEYLSVVTAKLPGENEVYRSIRDEIETLYEAYPKVLEIFDAEKTSDLNEQECTALIKVLELKSRLTDMEMESIYFRGCCDGIGYLKKAGILGRDAV
ncbi:DUF6664 family protein [Schaedlerella sp.]|uniref:DUF6664 family protein n=1 Tax=Schaedlerella sp. TaxID=2676057 RepID=UPI0037462F0B|nr:hypothetical protein [Ruminococcus sp.]